MCQSRKGSLNKQNEWKRIRNQEPQAVGFSHQYLDSEDGNRYEIVQGTTG
jgi:hypothetical protein